MGSSSHSSGCSAGPMRTSVEGGVEVRRALMLELLRNTNPLCSPGWTAAGRSFGDLMFWLPPRARVELEGLEHLPKGPAIFAPNHTHKFDFFPVRCALLHRGVHLMTWIKARDYQHTAMRWILGKGGNIPLVSRGFIIASDFVQVHGRKPSEEEYRALRLHVDEGTPLEDSLAEGLAAPRRIAGVEVDLSQGYRAALRHAYHQLMEEASSPPTRACGPSSWPGLRPRHRSLRAVRHPQQPARAGSASTGASLPLRRRGRNHNATRMNGTYDAALTATQATPRSPAMGKGSWRRAWGPASIRPGGHRRLHRRTNKVELGQSIR